MSFKKALIYLTVTYLITACATLSENQFDSDYQLSLSCHQRDEVYSEPYIGVSCIFENHGSRPLELEVKDVSLIPGKKDYRITGPEEIASLKVVYDHRGNNQKPNSRFLGGLYDMNGVMKNETQQSNASGFSLTFSFSRVATKSFAYSKEHLLGNKLIIKEGGAIVKHLLISLKRFQLHPEGLEVCVSKPQRSCLPVKIKTPTYINRFSGYLASED